MMNFYRFLAGILVFAAFISLNNRAFAGNLELKYRIQLPDNIEYEDDTEVEIDIENINPTYAVTGIVA
ncbi:MAG: hypothetical protein ACLFQU_09625, partial [Candidatus Kapaibacterium sp.]